MFAKDFILAIVLTFLSYNLIAGDRQPPDMVPVNSGGLKFSSKDVYSSQRTSLKLFKDYKSIPKSFNLKFICNIYDPLMFGFVLRVVNDFGSYKAPLIHLLYIPSQSNSDSCAFEFHFSNSEKYISFDFDTLHLNHVSFEINASVKDKVISIRCNNSEEKVAFEFPKEMHLNFLFGLYGENTDVAPMILQNIGLRLNNQTAFFWPLNDWSGNAAHEKVNHIESEVHNPVWLQNKHYNWEKIYTGKTDPMAGIIFDDQNNILFISKDSLLIYNPQKQELKAEKYATARPFDKNAIFTVYNSKTRKIIAYDFHFLKVRDGKSAFSVYDRDARTWTLADTSGGVDQNHHHSTFWNQDTTNLLFFGGYSYFHYYNEFKSYNFTTGLWEQVKFTGDSIYPRTHTSIGRDPYTGKYYLYGGFGNKEGLQPLEGRYFYDLYTIDLDSKTISKIWNIASPEFEFVPRGNPVFKADENVCYVLGNKPIEKSYLKLYEINLREPKISIASDSIPVVFSDMAGNAFLFYNQSANELYCVTRETTHQSYASTSVFRLKFPPSGPPENIVRATETFNLKYWLIVIPVILLGAVFYFLKYHKHQIKIFPERIQSDEKFERRKRNAIWLLNEFRVFDKEGRDITYRFAKKIKQAFLVLFFENYYNQGILSADFSDILWPALNKDHKKNNRGVIINSIRKIFEDMSGISLNKDNIHWKLIFGPDLYIDFIEIQKVLQSERNNESNDIILNYFSIGSLLHDENWEYLDQYKEKYATAAMGILLEFCKLAFVNKNYMKSIEISDIILTHFDFLNESALIYKIKALYLLKNSSKAVSEYNKFRQKYNDSISKNFHLSFESILNMAVPIENADF